MRADRTVARPGLLDSSYDYVIAALVAVVIVLMLDAWVTGQLAGLLFRQAWPPVTPAQAFSAALALPHHWADPRLAWPAAARSSLPGAPGFAVAGGFVALLLCGAVAVTLRWLAARHPQRGLASPARLRHPAQHRGPEDHPGRRGRRPRTNA